ncbi:zinc-binding dehydrogenase [Streptomyces castrisilvae]|uniref:Zinc-binding dehydrogenase n=1 Tax=Streptomyces castrisilvae TaxID=3033811 RepID=A0ABY9HRM9_9ACTN|nr:zinc-binding dehydrogenase [Streptomyces sp. Mut1]WLQ37217.1 zinc-binding dehydrogenase [Streptomyces sp. Mut1]
MRAMRLERPGGPEALRLRDVPTPEAREGWTLVRVRAFGLNRSELFTRRGASPDVRLPRIPGIECVGTVERSTDPRLPAGTVVAAAMGGMGRRFDGSYAEFALLPTAQLIPVRTELPWTTLAALPESWLTAWGTLDTLDLRPGHRLVIRAATSSVGMAALALAAGGGVETAATTRDPGKRALLREHGADHVLLDTGNGIGDAVRSVWSDGADRIVDLVGGTAVLDSLKALAPRGRVCNTGILSDTWTIPGFEPLEDIPSGATLTTYSSSEINHGDRARDALDDIVRRVESGACRVGIDRVFALEELVAAHRHMEANRATGKVVAVVHHT